MDQRPSSDMVVLAGQGWPKNDPTSYAILPRLRPYFSACQPGPSARLPFGWLVVFGSDVSASASTTCFVVEITRGQSQPVAFLLDLAFPG